MYIYVKSFKIHVYMSENKEIKNFVVNKIKEKNNEAPLKSNNDDYEEDHIENEILKPRRDDMGSTNKEAAKALLMLAKILNMLCMMLIVGSAAVAFSYFMLKLFPSILFFLKKVIKIFLQNNY